MQPGVGPPSGRQPDFGATQQSLDRLALNDVSINHQYLQPQQGEELSFYALDISSISDLIQQ